MLRLNMEFHVEACSILKVHVVDVSQNQIKLTQNQTEGRIVSVLSLSFQRSPRASASPLLARGPAHIYCELQGGSQAPQRSHLGWLWGVFKFGFI